ncbi:BamA/TamA family outer membrane protein [Aurantibacter sp.]|uniref:translocation and assembly module lipoprotein TamL n=1 Tax=Aurantibacter sp. TaxID=2807103 RepID=UPI0035C7D9F7
MSSCNSLKRVGKNKHLLTKNSILVNDTLVKNETLTNLIYQKPNKKLLKTPLRLFIYNLARPNIDSLINSKIYENPKKLERKTKFLSRKQVDKLAESKRGFNAWLKKMGEAPVIVNDSLSEKSLKLLRSYYWNNGWFNVTLDYDTKKDSNQRAKTTYKITTGKPYILDSLNSDIKTAAVDSIYQLHKSKSFLKKGQQYRTANILNEKKRITDLMRNNGVFHFSQDYFLFAMDTFGINNHTNVDMKITNRSKRSGDSTITEPFKIYKIKDVNIYTNSSFESRNQSYTDTTSFNGYKIYSQGKLKYKPKALTNSVFITPNTIFKDKNRPLTSRKISDLKTFKYPRIEYIENIDTTLTTNIYLNPYKKWSLGFSTEITQSNIQTIGFSLIPSLKVRNLFRGAETLELSGFTSIGASKDAANNRDDFFDINELGVNLKLNIPRFLFPFNTERIIPKSMFPATKITLATTSQTNVGLDKQTFSGVFNYTWYPNNNVTNRLDVFNIQYVKNLNTSNYFNVYQNSFNTLNSLAQSNGYVSAGTNLEIPSEANQFLADVTSNSYAVNNEDFLTINAIDERKERLTEDNLIIASNFNYVKDKRESISDNAFSIFRFKLETAGNLASLLAKPLNLKKNENNNYELFKVGFSQYVKTEIDYIKYWSFGNKNTIAIRSFFGIAIPFGNASSIPFSKSFFAGGANDNRAWTAYNLGPGSLNSNNEFNEANLKLTLSAEQRFNIFGALNGALFLDAGNIWNVLDDVAQEEATFNSFSSLKDIAIGSGFGFRYDFDFFILRLDIGFKTYDPSYQNKNRWFNDYNFSKAVYNIGINYPF